LGFLLVGAVLVAGTYYGLTWALSGDRGFLSLAAGIGAPDLLTPTPPVVVTTTPRPTTVPTPIPSPTPRVYVVKPGDTLTRIARDHETTVDELVETNSLDRQALLNVGQKLVIPPPAPGPGR
jgi:LysM repeat protein